MFCAWDRTSKTNADQNGISTGKRDGVCALDRWMWTRPPDQSLQIEGIVNRAHNQLLPRSICSSRKDLICIHETDNKLLGEHTDYIQVDRMIYPDVVFVSCVLLNPPGQFSDIHASRWSMFFFLAIRSLQRESLFMKIRWREHSFIFLAAICLNRIKYFLSSLFLCIFLLEIITTAKPVWWKTSLSHPLPSFPKKIDTLRGMKYNTEGCLPKECLKFLWDNALFQNKAISGNSILVCTKRFIGETFFQHKYSCSGALSFKGKKKVF